MWSPGVEIESEANIVQIVTIIMSGLISITALICCVYVAIKAVEKGKRELGWLCFGLIVVALATCPAELNLLFTETDHPMTTAKKIITEAMGWLASVFFLSGYFLVSRKKIEADGKSFNLMNLAGALFFSGYAVMGNLIPLLVFEILFIIIIAKLLYKIYFKPKNLGPGI